MSGQRSPLLYGPGMKLAIQAHTPPTPIAARYKHQYPAREPVRGLSDKPFIDRLDFALLHPPVDTPHCGEAKSDVLTIVEKLDRREQGRDGGAHVVTCNLDSDTSRLCVAKIYDGIDYPLTDDMDCDFMYMADRDYSCEAAAYRSIPKHLRGSIVPLYFGSWTCSIETGMPDRPYRCVRLILLEYIKGECMLDMILRAKGVTRPTQREAAYDTLPVNYKLLPPEPDRLAILARIIEAEITLFDAGINHRDLAPRNVLISQSPKRIVLIDFGQSTVFKHYPFGRQLLKSNENHALPISPIQRYWNSSCFKDDFAAWCPQAWLMDHDGAKKWMLRRWRGSTMFRPVEEGFRRVYRRDRLLNDSLC